MLKRIILCCCLAFLMTNAESGAVSEPSQWAVKDCERAVAAGLVPNRLQQFWQEPITREAFCEMAMGLLSERGLDLNTVDITKHRFADTGAEHVRQAAALGVVKGTQNDASGAWFSPDTFITRQEAAVMLYRLAQTDALPNPQTAQLASHTWHDRHAPAEYMENGVERSHFYQWALDGVAFCYNSGVMAGLPDNCFGPNEQYTVEQSAITLLRLRNWAAEGGKANKAENIIMIESDPAQGTFGYRTLGGRILYDETIPIPTVDNENGHFIESIRNWGAETEQGDAQYMLVPNGEGTGWELMSTEGVVVPTAESFIYARILSDTCAYVIYNETDAALISLPSGQVLQSGAIILDKLSPELWTVTAANDNSGAPYKGVIDCSGKMIIPAEYKYYGELYDDCFVAVPDHRKSPHLYAATGELLSDQCGIDKIEQYNFYMGFGPYMVLQASNGQMAIYHFDGTEVFADGKIEQSNIQFAQEGLVICGLTLPMGGPWYYQLFDFSGKPVSKEFYSTSEGEVLYGRYLLDFVFGDEIVPCLCDKYGNIIKRDFRCSVTDGGNTMAWSVSIPKGESNANDFITSAIVTDENGEEIFRVHDVSDFDFHDGLFRVLYADATVSYYSTSGVLLN